MEPGSGTNKKGPPLMFPPGYFDNPDTGESVIEHVYELLLCDERLHTWIVHHAASDLMDRGLAGLPKEQYDELMVINQLRFMGVMLSRIVSGEIN